MNGLLARPRLLRVLILVTLLAFSGTQLLQGGAVAAADADLCLHGPPGPGALCIGADLHGVQLPGADLRGADFAGADLSGADLTGADLSGARLAGADLTGARLAGATLHGAVLVGAEMDGSDLSNVDLTAADLTGASWDGATLNGTSLPASMPFGAGAVGVSRTPSVSGRATGTVQGSTSGGALSGGPQATFRLCGGAAPDTDRAIEQFLAGAGFRVTLSGRADGCADLTVTRASGGTGSGQQSTNLSVSSGAADSGRIVVRISSENGSTSVDTGA